MSRTGSVRGVFAITLILSACSLLYELLIAQTLSLLAGNTVVWYSLTVGTYLGAMGIGAIVSERFTRGGWGGLYVVELLLSAAGALGVVALLVAHSVTLYFSVTPRPLSTLVFFGVSFTMTILIGVLSGIELPLLIKLGNDVAGETKVTNRVLGWDYIGALVGALAFPLVLVPNFDLLAIGFGTAAVNLLIALYVLQRFLPRDAHLGTKAAWSVPLASLLFIGLVQSPDMQQYFLKRYYFYIQAATRGSLFGGLKDLPDIYRANSPYQKIDIVHDPDGYTSDVLIDAFSTKYIKDPSQPKNRWLFLNGDFQVTSNYEELYHEWFAHVPIMLSTNTPERVLVMGGGDGLLIRELLKYNSIRTIKHVDLDRKLVELAKSHPTLLAMNGNALDDPRVETQFGDAYQYIRKSDETFDAIYLDFPFPMDYNVSKLYSREFFHFVRRRLAVGGYAVLDAAGTGFYTNPDEDGNLRLMRGGDWDIYYNTIRSAGFESIISFHTRLDSENQKAFELLETWNQTPTFANMFREEAPRIAARRQWMREFVASHVIDLKQGFILMWNGDRDPLVHEYRDLGIELHVLNETRFNRAFPPPFARGVPIDQRLVNSILRPTLPTAKIWSIREPW